jgi:L-lactate dehydrogenase complex protein LldG
MRRGDDGARETILARIREALRVPAPMPHLKAAAPVVPPPAQGPHGLPSLSILPEEAARPWLPDGGDTPEARLCILVDNLGKLRAAVERVPDGAAAAACVARLATERGWRRVGVHGHPMIDPVAADLPCEVCRVDAANSGDAAAAKDLLESCDAGITACDVLVSQTGSILVTSTTAGGRGLSILPHVHVVIATLDQIVGTLADALHQVRQRHAGAMPSMLSFITGPSRTGDIERILVLGAHGPKELVVVLVG